jgi:hypothetical protein
MTESRSSSKEKSKKTGKQLRETARLRAANKRTRDNTNGFRLVQVLVPKDAVDVLKQIANWLRDESNYHNVEGAIDILAQHRKKRAGLAPEDP